MKNSNSGYVFLDQSTNFNGEVKAQRVVLEGKIGGVVHADRELHLKSGAYIEGKIYTENFSADSGSSCNGELHIKMPEGNETNKVEKQLANKGNKNSFFTRVANLLSLA